MLKDDNSTGNPTCQLPILSLNSTLEALDYYGEVNKTLGVAIQKKRFGKKILIGSSFFEDYTIVYDAEGLYAKEGNDSSNSFL